MKKLRLSIAMGNYDRTRAIIDGRVPIEGITPTVLTMGPEEIFFRAFRNAEFDICELSLSSVIVRTARNDCPYIGVPIFLSRAFRHTSIYIRTDRGIEKPGDLKGRRIGTPEYQLTACVWARALLEDDFGVKPSDITWVRGGIEEAGRPEKIKLNLPGDVRIEEAPRGATLNAMLEQGEIDGMITPRAPSCYQNGHKNVGRLFPNSEEVARDYYQRTGIFPIMHLIGIRKNLVEAHPWLAVNVAKAFQKAKDIALKELNDTAAFSVMLPFLPEYLEESRNMLGDDIWSYGIEGNVPTLEAFLRHHHSQGLSDRLVEVQELFHPATVEHFRI